MGKCVKKKKRDKNHTSNNNLWAVAGFRAVNFYSWLPALAPKLCFLLDPQIFKI